MIIRFSEADRDRLNDIADHEKSDSDEGIRARRAIDVLEQIESEDE